MGSVIPIKLPENAFSQFGESVVSRRILRFLPRRIGLRTRWSLLSIVKTDKVKIPASLMNVVRVSHKNEEEPPLYKPQSAQGTGKREMAPFQNGIFLISSGWTVPVFYSFLHFLAFMRLDSGGF